jgi:hypothetical protein
MSEVLKQFMASMHYAANNQRHVNIAGNEFNPERVRQLVQELEVLIGSAE